MSPSREQVCNPTQKRNTHTEELKYLEVNIIYNFRKIAEETQRRKQSSPETHMIKIMQGELENLSITLPKED